MSYEQKQIIMILEDDEDLAEGIRLSLNSREFTFWLCRTIAEAEELFRQHPFDLLIVDINLPMGADFRFAAVSAASAGFRLRC